MSPDLRCYLLLCEQNTRKRTAYYRPASGLLNVYKGQRWPLLVKHIFLMYILLLGCMQYQKQAMFVHMNLVFRYEMAQTIFQPTLSAFTSQTRV